MGKNLSQELLDMVTDITNRLKDIDDTIYGKSKDINDEIENMHATLDYVKMEIRGDSENFQTRITKLERKIDKLYDLLGK